MTSRTIPISFAKGDGIGPEIMDAVLHILKHSGASLDLKEVEIGEQVYLKGERAGIAPDTWDMIRNTEAFLKAPITTPQGGGFKSLNVTVRTTLGLYANIRPCIAYYPFVSTKQPEMDVVVIRENEEDLYTGIEYRQSPQTFQALKIITRPGCEKIIRYAFEYARTNGRKKVTCFTKDNILKRTDGLFHQIFEEIAKEYPDIENEHWIIDIGAAKLAANPELFDVVVLANLYGDILSDVTAQLTGSVGLAGSANIGEHGAMFEAIHGSAPRHAGKNSANPSGLLLAAVMMLVHINEPEAAAKVHNAWLKTIEDGVHTYDIFKEGTSKKKVGTKEFAEAVVERLGQTPKVLKEVHYNPPPSRRKLEPQDLTSLPKEETVGVDVFIQHTGDVESLQQKIHALDLNSLKMTMIANRGVMVWPSSLPETTCSDIWRCRFMGESKEKLVSHEEIAHLLSTLAAGKINFVQTANLNKYDGEMGYTVAQDEQ